MKRQDTICAEYSYGTEANTNTYATLWSYLIRLTGTHRPLHQISATVPQLPPLGLRAHMGPAESVPIVLIVEALLKRDSVGVGLANHIQGVDIPKDRPPHMLESLL